jgi:hypothetical protein
MNREERRGLSRLPPLMTDWEVVVSEDPSLEGGGGIVVVVSTDPVDMRHTEVVETDDKDSIVNAVVTAMVEPMSGDPGRPRTIRVVDPELSDLLSAKLKGAKIAFRVVDELPALAALTEEFEAEIDELDHPGITVFQAEFRQVLDRLIAHSPWELLSECLIRFDSKTIDVGAPVLNVLIKQSGFRVFANEDDAADFFAEDEDADAPAIELALLTDDEVGEPGRWQAVGLAMDGGLYPSLSHLGVDGSIEDCNGDTQYTVLVLLEALAGYLDTHRDAVARGEQPSGSTVVPTGSHNITVRVEAIDPPPSAE